MRQPVTPTEALQCINSTIKSTGLKKKVQSWEQKHNKLTEEVMDDGPLGKIYWLSFLKHHPSLVTKTSTCFDSNQEEWCNVTNVEQMYHSCYEKMVESGIAFKMSEEVWLDKDGVVVEEESEAMGRPTKYILN